MKIDSAANKSKITKVEITNDVLSGRGGLALLLRYIDSIGAIDMIENAVGDLRGSSKGLPMGEMARQVIACFLDGSDKSMTGFDSRRDDNGYGAVLQRSTEELAGSAMVKRFFRKFNGTRYAAFRSLINELFVWRLSVEKPQVIVLHLDTMVLDNDDASKREGVNPTYKDVCGFQPLQINWGPYIIDMHFRSGEKHSNHGDDAREAVARIVRLIRTRYQTDTPIIVSTDSGFLSEENLLYFEETLGIQYVVMGKQYDSVYEALGDDPDTKRCGRLERKDAAWVCYDFRSMLKSWHKEYRTILTSLQCEDDQYVIEGIRDTIMYTNLGTDARNDNELIKRGYASYLTGTGIAGLAHKNGAEELNHRSIKEFMGSEHLPFKRFGMNGAYYGIMLIAHTLMEAFRCDILHDVIPQRCYPTRIRREVIDIAVKIVRTGRQVIMKVTEVVAKRISIFELWRRCAMQPALR
jgi:hypothetical protein